jgi:hypothetical protein
MSLHEDKGTVAPFAAQQVPSRLRTRANVDSESELNVLVIDDTPEARMAVRRALRAGGFVPQEAATLIRTPCKSEPNRSVRFVASL